MTVADVAFDVPVPHPFSYRVPDDCAVTVGQRVVAPLGRAQRTGVIVGLRDDGGTARLKPLLRLLDAGPVLDPDGVDLARWVAAQSLSSLGSTLAALVPPVVAVGSEREAGLKRGWPVLDGSRLRTPSDAAARAHSRPELLVGAGRETRVLERIGAGPALVIVPDIESAARGAQRLGKRGEVVRLVNPVEDASWPRAGGEGRRVSPKGGSKRRRASAKE